MLDISALEPKIAEAAKLMEMLSQPVRLRLMCILLDGEQSVLSLADSAGLSQPAMSHHLKKLGMLIWWKPDATVRPSITR